MNPVSIDQFTPSVRDGDGVGNEIVLLQRMLRARGFTSEIYAEIPCRACNLEVHPWSAYRGRASDLLIVHYAIHSPLFDRVFASSPRKLLQYHNVTPRAFLEGVPEETRTRLREAREKLALYRDSVELAVAASDYSARDLLAAGFPRVRVCPYRLSHDLYAVPPDAAVLKRCGDGVVNLLMVGRIAANKCIEDGVLAFHYFHRRIEPRSRLFVIGDATGTEAYARRLERLVRGLHLAGSVVFTGRLSQAALNAHYRTAAALLVMSEHEGFCVPPIEAMLFDVPVFAYDACATPETMRGAGVLFPAKDHAEIAETIGVVLSDPAWRARLLSAQRHAAEFYSPAAAEHRLSETLSSLGLSAPPAPPRTCTLTNPVRLTGDAD